jgi:hypothetical protein
MSRRALVLLAAVALPFAYLAPACGSGNNNGSSGSGASTGTATGTGGGPAEDPGALLDATMASQVGVLLDEIPMSERDRVAQAIIAQPMSFWITRATNQAKLTTYRLVFRQLYYPFTSDGKPTRDSLPLTLPTAWNITFTGAPQRTMVMGHDMVTVSYNLATTILTTFESPGKSQPELGKIGGTWDEPFVFPVDPELVFQRTGYACMDESEFPPNSVDSEEVDSFYDQTCGVEAMETHTGCHYSALPQLSCIDALKTIGSVSTKLHFERVPWDGSVADKVRSGAVTTDAGANLTPYSDEFHINRVTYRYIDSSSCTLVEKCVGGTGWRRLLQFATADINSGNLTLAIGKVDYFGVDDAGTPLSQHGVFEWSACHGHFHFMHYGTFSYGDAGEETSKRGFCLQATKRTSNNEISPLTNVYYDCGYQGIEIGWADEYKAGLECQWIDVTEEDTNKAPVTKPLSFHSNPDGFLCEGKPILDKNGNQVWLPTSFKTADGRPVEKPACDYSPGWANDNFESYMATLELSGDGYVTEPCTRGQLGPLRNCALTKQIDTLQCTPGAQVTLSCTVPAGAQPQVLRVCETSAVLQTGIPCVQAQELAHGTVDIGTTPTTVTFTCPPPRDPTEPGGGYALYTGAAYPSDTAVPVNCTAM